LENAADKRRNRVIAREEFFQGSQQSLYAASESSFRAIAAMLQHFATSATDFSTCSMWVFLERTIEIDSQLHEEYSISIVPGPN
jgi:hypothetical protein